MIKGVWFPFLKKGFRRLEKWPAICLWAIFRRLKFRECFFRLFSYKDWIIEVLYSTRRWAELFLCGNHVFGFVFCILFTSGLGNFESNESIKNAWVITKQQTMAILTHYNRNKLKNRSKQYSRRVKKYKPAVFSLVSALDNQGPCDFLNFYQGQGLYFRSMINCYDEWWSPKTQQLSFRHKKTWYTI